MAPRQLAKRAHGTLCQHGSTQDRADGILCVSMVIMLMSESIDHVEYIISMDRLGVPC